MMPMKMICKILHQQVLRPETENAWQQIQANIGSSADFINGDKSRNGSLGHHLAPKGIVVV